MDTAYALANEALIFGEVPIGCAFVFKNEVIAFGRNETNESGNATQHAEIVAIRRLETWCHEKNIEISEILSESTFYVTVEPCIMCAAALRFCLPKQPKCVVYSSPNDRFGGCGSVMGISTDKSIGPALVCETDGRSNESIKLLKKFFDQSNINAPEEKRKNKDMKIS